MCHSQGVSIVTYVIVVVIAIIIFMRNRGSDRHIAMFILAFVTIQFWEAFLWDAVDRGDDKQNDLVTRLILISLWFQPLVNVIGAASVEQKRKNFMILSALFVVYGLLFFGGIVTASGPEKFKTEKGPNCHLVWNRGSHESGTDFMSDHGKVSALYLAGLFLPLLFIKPVGRAVFLTSLGVGTMVFARKMSSKTEFSSWWCWVAGAWAVGALLT